MYRRAVSLAATALLITAQVDAQKPDTLSRAFERLDLEAQFMMDYLRCSSATFQAITKGVMADPDSGTYLLCANVKDRMIAAFVKPDSSGKRAISLRVLDPARMVERREPTDTAEILVLLRAKRWAEWFAWSDSAAHVRGIPIVYRSDTLIHAWVIPNTMFAHPNLSVGGERHYMFPADAKKELFKAPIPATRPIAQTNGEWLIRSIGDSIPTFSEILMAHMLAEDRLPVTIELPHRYVKLVTSPPNMGVWVWLPKKLD